MAKYAQAWSQAYKNIPMPESNPCKVCSAREKCEMTCPASARWWDATVQKLKNRLGWNLLTTEERKKICSEKNSR